MASFRVCVLVALLCLSTAQFGSALRCYDCSTVLSAGCGDPFKKDGINTFECQPNQVCMKLKTKLIESTNRGCAPTNYCDALSAGAEHCSYCSGHDLCNSGSSFLPALTIIGLLVAIKNYFF